MNSEIQRKLEIYQNLLVKWQKSVNLVAPSTLESAWERHFEDSLQVSFFLKPMHKIIVDLGSGAGFPGLVTAILKPEKQIHLIESDQKKCAFLKTVSRETECQNVTIHNDRVEKVLKSLAPHVITARAFASLIDILDYVSVVLPNQDLRLILHKGRNAKTEIIDAQERYDFACDIHQSSIEEDSFVLKIWDIVKKS